MFKKTLISLAVASSLGLTGCFDNGGSGSNANPDYKISNPDFDGKTWPLFNPITGELPLPNDLIFRSDDPDTTIIEADGSFSVTDTSPPVTSALNRLSGASTVAPAVVHLNGQIDPDSVDSRPFIIMTTESGAVPAPNPNQNVFLIELEYASGDPVQGLGMGEPPTIPLAITAQVAAGALPQDLEGRDQAAAGAYLASLAQNPPYTHEVVELDGTSAIRIHPTTPLDPKKRYLVVVTSEVKDINGDPIVASPTYSNLTDETQPLGTSSLAAVRTIINSFWESVAGSYFGVNNTTRPTPLTVDDIALSYSFTTSNDEEVLKYIADPTAYFRDTVAGAARVAGVKAAIDGGETDYTALATAAATAEADANPDAVASALSAGLAALLPTPEDRGSSATFGDPQDVTLVSAIVGQFVDYGDVNIVQGTIDLPYYLGIPAGQTEAEGAVINTSDFTANLTAAANIGDQLGVQLAQSDESVSDVVNYRFPFPEATNTTQTVPIIILYPASYDGSTPLETVIYQHGITTDRSTALTFGSALAKSANVAVVAIDLPLHGVAPFSEADQEELAGTLLEAAGQTNDEATRNAVINGTFKVGVLLQIQAGLDAANPGGAPNLGISDPNDPAQIQSAISTVLSGALDALAPTAKPSLAGAIGLESAVANAGSTVPGLAQTENERHFNFTAGASNQPVPMTDTSGASGSLFINLTNFTNSRDKIRQGVLDLLNLRASLGTLDFDGTAGADLDPTQVYFTGHSLGAIVGAPFVAVANSSANTADDIIAAQLLTPGAGIVRMLENSPSFAPSILGGLQAAAGLEQGDADLETFLNVFQAALDSTDPINFADDLSDSKVVLSQVNGDQVIPNDPLNNPLGAAFDAYLSGTEPFARLLDATSVTGDGVPVPVSNATITRYLEGSHSTPVLPQDGPLDERVFAEMVSETASVIAAKGTAVVPNPADLDPDITEIVQQD